MLTRRDHVEVGTGAGGRDAAKPENTHRRGADGHKAWGCAVRKATMCGLRSLIARLICTRGIALRTLAAIFKSPHSEDGALSTMEYALESRHCPANLRTLASRYVGTAAIEVVEQSVKASRSYTLCACTNARSCLTRRETAVSRARRTHRSQGTCMASAVITADPRSCELRCGWRTADGGTHLYLACADMAANHPACGATCEYHTRTSLSRSSFKLSRGMIPSDLQSGSQRADWAACASMEGPPPSGGAGAANGGRKHAATVDIYLLRPCINPEGQDQAGAHLARGVVAIVYRGPLRSREVQLK